MPQFYPDGPATVSMSAIDEAGGLNTLPEENYNTTALQGSMQQLLAENLGKFVIADFLVGVSTIVRRAGVLYSVGRSYVVLYLDEYKAFEVCDIFSLKFLTFFPPGREPSVEELNQGLSNSGILSPAGVERALGNIYPRGGMNPAGGSGYNAVSGTAGVVGRAGNPGCRTLGQR